MDFKTFTDFTSSVFNHNFLMQKNLESENHIVTIRKLKEYVTEYPLADIFLHYPGDDSIKDLNFCYSVNGESPNQLLPALSAYLSEGKIVLSYLTQKELDKLDFSDEFKVFEHYMNSARIIKYLYNDTLLFSPQNDGMIFMEYIPDTLNWNSNSEKHKAYNAFSFISFNNLMLWTAYYFTPHY